MRSGLLAVLPDVKALDAELPKLLDRFAATASPINVLHIALREAIAVGAEAEEAIVAAAEQALNPQAAALQAKGLSYVSFTVPNPAP